MDLVVLCVSIAMLTPGVECIWRFRCTLRAREDMYFTDFKRLYVIWRIVSSGGGQGRLKTGLD